MDSTPSPPRFTAEIALYVTVTPALGEYLLTDDDMLGVVGRYLQTLNGGPWPEGIIGHRGLIVRVHPRPGGGLALMLMSEVPDDEPLREGAR